ncbi:MAG: chitobiase/beta-hexosaminidase C-terminal domain-containing protein, partial [bacterium]|nr:chitobiase/beta-hexosaminidase C-terminal domain-containing protein [bacterium]
MDTLSRILLGLGLILPVCMMLTPRAALAAGAKYYVSQSSGRDDSDGLAPEWDGTHGPWKTLARASAVRYQAGDQLLLKCGDVWDEILTVAGDGTAANPVTVASYGEGERPFIRRSVGGGNVCLIIDKSSGVCIRDLELGYAQNAIRFVVDSRAKVACENNRIENCFLHDITNPTYPDPAKREGYRHNDLRNMGWAIFIDALDSPGEVLLRNLTVRNCLGLRAQGFYLSMGPVRQKDFVFDGNSLVHNSYNSIYQTGTRFDITNSVFVYAYPWKFNPMGATQVLAGGLKGDATVRNIVRGNEFGWAGDYPNCPDGCGYDFEGATDGVTFQNNYVHDSYGEAVLFMGKFTHRWLIFDHNVLRHNVAFSPRWEYEVTLNTSNQGDGVFSNNVFFTRPGIRAFNSKPSCFTFSNNDENARGVFAPMPLVTRIERRRGARLYTLACMPPGATIRYTLDGSLPTTASAVCDGPIAMRRSGVINAKAFLKGAYPSCVNSIAVELRDAEGRGPAAWWKLDEQDGDRIEDAAGASHGTLAGAARASGRLGGGLQFSGRDEVGRIEPAGLASLADTFTVSFWAEPTKARTATPEVGTGAGIVGTAWWKLDDGSGLSLPYSSGGAGGSTWTEGKFGKALAFNGAGDYVVLANAGVKSVADTFTISFWAAPEADRESTPESNT